MVGLWRHSASLIRAMPGTKTAFLDDVYLSGLVNLDPGSSKGCDFSIHLCVLSSILIDQVRI